MDLQPKDMFMSKKEKCDPEEGYTNWGYDILIVITF